MKNRVCLKCGTSYEAKPGQVTGGLCPRDTKLEADKAKAWGQNNTRGAVAYRPDMG